MLPKISVIIPVYNVELYLEQCLNSILKQDYDNMEVILVNDGSTDNSAKICMEYAEKYEVFKVIHQTNGGLSSARNTGIKNATGEYLVFVDSDDWIEENFINHLVDTITDSQNLDVVVIKVHSYNNENQVLTPLAYHINEKCIYKGVEIFKLLYNCKDFWGAAWQFVVNRDFLIKNNLFFVDNLYHEDEMYSPMLLIKAQKIKYSSKIIYLNRTNRSGSIISTLNIKKEYDKIKIIESFLEKSNTKGCLEDIKILLRSRTSQLYMGVLMNSNKYVNTNEYKDFISTLYQLRFVLLYNSFKYKYIFIMICLLGVKTTSKILNMK